MVRFGKLVRGGRAFERADEDNVDDADGEDVAWMLIEAEEPGVRVAPPGSDERGGGSIELLVERWGDDVEPVEEEFVFERLLVALEKETLLLIIFQEY